MSSSKSSSKKTPKTRNELEDMMYLNDNTIVLFRGFNPENPDGEPVPITEELFDFREADQLRQLINSGIPLTRNILIRIERNDRLGQKYKKLALKREISSGYTGTNKVVLEDVEEAKEFFKEREELAGRGGEEGLVREVEEDEATIMEEDVLAEDLESEELYENNIRSTTLDKLKRNDKGEVYFETSDEIYDVIYALTLEIEETQNLIASRQADGTNTDKLEEHVNELTKKSTEFSGSFAKLREFEDASPASVIPPQVPPEVPPEVPPVPSVPPVIPSDPNPVPKLSPNPAADPPVESNQDTVDPNFISPSGSTVNFKLQSEFKPKYHLIPIAVMYGSVEIPQWDEGILMTVSQMKSKDVNKLIDAVIREYKYKLLLFKRKSNGDLVELNEVLQLQYSFERGMQINTRGPKGLIDLKDLTSISNSINDPSQITPQDDVNSALSATQNAGKSVVIKDLSNLRQKPVFKVEEIKKPQNMSYNAGDDLVNY